jgi:drug/metabolite transporter (DMT)-like permease
MTAARLIAWPRSQRMRGLALLLIGTALISVMDALVKWMSTSLGTLQITWGRYATQAILLFIVFTPQQSIRRLRTRRPSLHLLRAAMLLLSTLLFFGALRTLTLAEANAIGFTTPLIITMLSGLLLGEAVGARRWAAVCVGFAGVLIVIRPGSGVMGWAALLPLIGAACSALYHVTTRLVARTDDPANTLYFAALLGGIGLSAVVPFFWTPLTAVLLASMVAVGTLGTVGHFFLIRAFQIVPASTLSPFMYVYLLWATILGWAVFGDVPDLATLVGAAVILLSGLYVFRQRPEPGDTLQ